MTQTMKMKASKTSAEGVHYQCELPLDVELQLEMTNLMILEGMSSGVDLNRVKTQLDNIIIKNSNIATDKEDLLVMGDKKKNLNVKHLIQLGVIYRQELLLPLLD